MRHSVFLCALGFIHHKETVLSGACQFRNWFLWSLQKDLGRVNLPSPLQIYVFPHKIYLPLIYAGGSPGTPITKLRISSFIFKSPCNKKTCLTVQQFLGSTEGKIHPFTAFDGSICAFQHELCLPTKLTFLSICTLTNTQSVTERGSSLLALDWNRHLSSFGIMQVTAWGPVFGMSSLGRWGGSGGWLSLRSAV